MLHLVITLHSFVVPAKRIPAQEHSQLMSAATHFTLSTQTPVSSDYAYGPTSLPPSIGVSSNAMASLSSSTMSLTVISGVAPSFLPNSTASTGPHATNSQPCNGYVELCNRRLSNVSLVVAHNSPFVVHHNAASNQALSVTTQLNDGIRGLHLQTRMVRGTLRLCHTSCQLLDVGPLVDYLATVARWLAAHPYEVIGLMIGNSDFVPPSSYIQPFKQAGLLPYLYVPSNSTYTLRQWPTLSEMILRNKRVVAMLDYKANQNEVPWLLDQFVYQWQTTFSPIDPSFPCIPERPLKEPVDVAYNKMYMVNHNLNIKIPIGGVKLLIPAYTLLDQVNAVSGNRSLGRMVNRCTETWGRPPNWLLVDYYNLGNFNGSVFQVAATANNVSYDRTSCCGMEAISGSVSNVFSTGQALHKRQSKLSFFRMLSPAEKVFIAAMITYLV